jgi:hypothetical protein
VDRALADESERALRERRAIVAKLAPGEWSEGTDRVVLRAVALPIARDDLLAPALIARLANRLEQAVDRVCEDVAVLPRHGLSKGWVRGDLAQARRLVVGAESVETGDGKAGAANCEVASQSPIPAERHQVVIHGAGLGQPR